MSYSNKLLKEEERDLFNQFVKNHDQGHILQTWEWGEVKAKTDWKPLRLMLFQQDKPVAAISILKRRLPGIKKCIFYAPRGPVAKLDDYEAMGELWRATAKLAKEHQAIMLKIDPDASKGEEELGSYLLKAGFRPARTAEGFDGTQPRFVFRLDITPSEDELMASFHSKTRYNIRLASKRGVTVRITRDKEDLKPFYEILEVTAKRDEFLIRGFSYFSSLWELLLEKGMGELFLAEYQGQAISGTLALSLGKKAWYLYGASANECRNVMPNYLLQWEMIKWAKSLGCTLYDFRGVSGDLSEDNPLYGLYRFKKGFNGELTEFVGEYDLVFSPFYYRLWSIAEPLYYDNLATIAKIREFLKK